MASRFWDTVGRAAADIGTGGLYEGYRYLNDKAAQGYNTAAQGAMQAYNQNQAFSNEQWGRQMEGLNRAQGYYQPAQDYWYNTYGSQGPGAAENYWAQNQQRVNEPGAQQGAYRDFRDWNQFGVNNTQQGANQSQYLLAGSPSSQQAYNRMGSQLQSYAPTTYGRDQYLYNQGDMNRQGTGESFYGQNQRRYDLETNANAAYETIAPKLYSEGYAQKLAEEGHLGSSVAGQSLGRHQVYAQAPTALARNEAENKGLIRGANQAADYYQSQLGALSGPGAYEQFVTADIAGANPLYERTRSRGVDTINQEMARRGGFKSGAALDRIGNYTAELDAQDYQNRANRAAQAQQMQLARIGQGQQAALGTAGLEVQRGTGLAGLDTAAEQAGLARQGFGLQAEKQASDEENFGAQMRLGAAQAADQAQLARLMGAGQLANAADASNQALLNSGQRAASDAQSQALARLMGSQNMANSVDQSRIAADQMALQRMMGSFGMAQGADQSTLARAAQLFNQGQGLDQNMLARYAMQGNMAQGLDQYSLAQLLGGGTLANQAQAAQQNRMGQAFGTLFGLNNAQAGNVGQFYGQGGNLSGQAMEDSWNALANAYGLQAQGAGARQQMLMQAFGMAGKLAGGYG